ncbi:hypothetical protein L9F63_016355, partial [Diploptera punctata]
MKLLVLLQVLAVVLSDPVFPQQSEGSGELQKSDQETDTPPASGVTEPPASVVTEPPASVVTEPPASVVTEPPASVVVTEPPASVDETTISRAVAEPPASVDEVLTEKQTSTQVHTELIGDGNATVTNE